MNKIVFILGDYFPKASANGICADKLIKEFQHNGYEVECVVNQHQNTPEKENINGVLIHRVKKPLGSRMLEVIDPDRKKLSEKCKFLLYGITRLLHHILTVFTYPRGSYLNCKRFYQVTDRIVRKGGCDVIIGINLPTNAMYAAYKIKKKYPDILFVPYFLDPMAEGWRHPILGVKKSFKRAMKLERKIIESSDRVFAMQEHRKHFEECYGKEQLCKIHFMGVPLLENKIDTNHYPKSGKKRILYAGSLSPITRDPTYIMEVFKYVKSAVLVMYITNKGDWIQEHSNENVEIHGRVPYEKIQEEMQNSDGFLNIGNIQTSSTPSKIIEYISYGKPIISTYRIQQDTSLFLLQNYPLAVLIDENSRNLMNAAKQIDDIIEKEGHTDFAAIKKLYGKNLPSAYAEVIADMIAKSYNGDNSLVSTLKR